MTIHLLRLAVGADSLQSMRDWRQDHQIQWQGRPVVPTYTKRAPTRMAELLDGGCIYWVVKGFIQCRQRFIGFDEVQDVDGTAYCRMLMDPELVETLSMPKRPFQGWRYLKPEEAPADLAGGEGGEALPEHLMAELRALGLA
ncbi:DUF1489 domain-containing protein [Niveispirillum sp. BGYR6]|uniref:DUF1489 family protein n=1 Tax=Niveispirillum sp. BGYR6 TaxID=2971249 RepID=UPI0022B99DCC|nr:DUF1489 domain-containing protein [Niveispirillum sp. BGYR6]MDG5496490.1 DUF1489 domain-containing protein [Niveispirillum sp. BGYR6]